MGKTTALECQHCYCLPESTTAVELIRHRCCQCGGLSPWTVNLREQPAPVRAWLTDREMIHDTVQAAAALASGADPGVRYEDLKAVLGDG